MADMRSKTSIRQDILENVDQAMLRMALLDMADEDLDVLEAGHQDPQSIAEMEAFYQGAEDRILSAIHGTLRKAKVRRFVKASAPKVAQAAAILIAVLSIGLTVAVAAVPAVRVRVMELLVKMQDGYVELSVQENEGLAFDVPAEWKGEYFPAYLQEGYEILDASNHVMFNRASFLSPQEQKIVFFECDSTYASGVDTAGAECEYVLVNGELGLLITRGMEHVISWVRDSKYFSIVCVGEKDEVLKIAESVRRIR